MNIVETNPDILDGTPIFRGTRVPVQALIDHIEAGDSLNDFLEDFPTVSREQVVEFLEAATRNLVATLT
ncbi:MAG TPA: DUF433 domain-containing protein [Phycisphaerae bacterium]|nr:DUF433 domain-containing protein [Phycisphaerae bacterium]